MEIVLNEKNFEEVINSNKKVLVDFWAPWCGPCRMVGPVVHDISVEYDGQIKVGKVNVDEEESLAIKFNINSIPSLLLFEDGKLVKQVVGYQSKENLIKFIGL